MTIVYIILLVLAAMAFILAEILTPFFGLMATLALLAGAAAVYLCFGVSSAAGLAGLVLLAIGLPVYAVVLVKLLPRTPLGRRVLLTPESRPPGEATPTAGRLAALVGKQGVAETVLRPAGMIRIDGRRIEAQAESQHIQAGARIRVVRAEGNFVVVRTVDGA